MNDNEWAAHVQIKTRPGQAPSVLIDGVEWNTRIKDDGLNLRFVRIGDETYPLAEVTMTYYAEVEFDGEDAKVVVR